MLQYFVSGRVLPITLYQVAGRLGYASVFRLLTVSLCFRFFAFGQVTYYTRLSALPDNLRSCMWLPGS